MSNSKSILDGLSLTSIAEAKKTVENVHSWEEALGYAKRRIRELQFSARVFKRMIDKKTPWPGDAESA